MIIDLFWFNFIILMRKMLKKLQKYSLNWQNIPNNTRQDLLCKLLIWAKQMLISDLKAIQLSDFTQNQMCLLNSEKINLSWWSLKNSWRKIKSLGSLILHLPKRHPLKKMHKLLLVILSKSQNKRPFEWDDRKIFKKNELIKNQFITSKN